MFRLQLLSSIDFFPWILIWQQDINLNIHLDIVFNEPLLSDSHQVHKTSHTYPRAHTVSAVRPVASCFLPLIYLLREFPLYSPPDFHHNPQSPFHPNILLICLCVCLQLAFLSLIQLIHWTCYTLHLYNISFHFSPLIIFYMICLFDISLTDYLTHFL